MNPIDRGNIIEGHLARTDYSDWFNVGKLNNGYFPLVDFQKGTTLVSLKSVDTAGTTWFSRMQTHIRDLGNRRATIDGNPANMVLDLRVQPGGAGAARGLVEYGQYFGVTVIVKEF
jgi:filamentous hemagglutinin